VVAPISLMHPAAQSAATPRNYLSLEGEENRCGLPRRFVKIK
jgi:hypothetical protein